MSNTYKKKLEIGDAVAIKFSVKHSDEDVPDIAELTIEELKAYRVELEEKIAQLDAIEPVDEEGEEYDNWADEHENLEDLIDEVADRLDELQE